MDEIFFCLKSFFISGLIIIALQIKISGTTLEERTEILLRDSKVARYLQESAAGGALAIHGFYLSIKEGLTGTPRQYQHGVQEQRARR